MILNVIKYKSIPKGVFIDCKKALKDGLYNREILQNIEEYFGEEVKYHSVYAAWSEHHPFISRSSTNTKYLSGYANPDHFALGFELQIIDYYNIFQKETIDLIGHHLINRIESRKLTEVI